MKRVLFFLLFLFNLSQQQQQTYSRQYTQNNNYMNGNCNIENGILHDQQAGITRPLTASEKAQLNEFENQMSLWNRQVQVITQRFTQRMANLFSHLEGISMEPFPPMPKVPCFCSSCVEHGNTNIGPIDSRDNIDADSDTDIESK